MISLQCRIAAAMVHAVAPSIRPFGPRRRSTIPGSDNLPVAGAISGPPIQGPFQLRPERLPAMRLVRDLVHPTQRNQGHALQVQSTVLGLKWRLKPFPRLGGDALLSTDCDRQHGAGLLFGRSQPPLSYPAGSRGRPSRSHRAPGSAPWTRAGAAERQPGTAIGRPWGPDISAQAGRTISSFRR